MKRAQVEHLLVQVNGATFAGMDCVTEVKTRKNLANGAPNPHHGKITKHANGHRVMLFSNTNSNSYENMVHKRLTQEGKDPADFKLGELKWGKRVKDTPIIEHNEKTYLQCIFLAGGEVEYRLENKPIPMEEIQGFDPKAESADQGGLENKVIVRTFGLDSIAAIRLFGEEVIDH